MDYNFLSRRLKDVRLLARLIPQMKPQREARIVGYSFPKLDRRTDTRRVRENDPGIRGRKTVRLEDEPMLNIRRGRSQIGNRNGSEKSLKLRKNNLRTVPRSVPLREAVLEFHDELTLTPEEIREIERKRAIEERWEEESYNDMIRDMDKEEQEHLLQQEMASLNADMETESQVELEAARTAQKAAESDGDHYGDKPYEDGLRMIKPAEPLLSPEARETLRRASENPRAMGFYPHQY